MSFGTWLFLTSVTDVIPQMAPYNAKRLLELYLLPLAFLLVLFSPSARRQFNNISSSIPGWVRVFTAIFFSLGVISALRTPHPAYPLVNVAMLFLILVMIIAIASSQKQVGVRFDQVAIALIAMTGIGIAFQEIVGLVVYINGGQQFNYWESFWHFLHPRFYSQIQTWTIPLIALLPFVFTRYRWFGLLSISLIGVQWYLVFSTGARGTTISLCLAMVVAAMIFPAARKVWLKTHATGLLLGVAFYLSVLGMMGLTQPDQNQFINESVGRPMLHTSGRTFLWHHALKGVEQQPWLGTGPMQFACDVDQHMPGSPHSFPIQILSEWGIPAFLLLGVIFSWLIYTWLRSAKPRVLQTDYRAAAVACLSISFLAVIIHICVSSLHITPTSQVTGMLVLGWLLGHLASSDQGLGKDRIKNIGNLVLLSGLLVSITLLIFSISELDEMSFRTSYAVENGLTSPGYWQDGRFCEYKF